MEMEEDPSYFRPWADLPEPLAEAVLELLPLFDYVHFAAVCRTWQSIQREHRRRHFPSPPPPITHPLPWLVSSRLRSRDTAGTDNNNNNNDDDDQEQGVFKCYSPLEKKHYRLPLPSGLRRPCDIHCFGSFHGWLLLTSHQPLGRSFESILTEPFLFNPVTRARIPLPPLTFTPNVHHVAVLSAPPTDPECTVFFVVVRGVLLHRLRGGDGWTSVRDAFFHSACSAIACRGKFYCHYHGTTVGVVDPLVPDPKMQLFEWDLGIPTPAEWYDPYYLRPMHLVEIDGEVCFLQIWVPDRKTIKDFRVFRADLSKKEWARVETIGDRVVFVDRAILSSLVAADIGFKKNAIYSSQYSRDGDDTCLWRAFDLDTGDWIAQTQVSYLEVGCRPSPNYWLLPTLDWAGTMQSGH